MTPTNDTLTGLDWLELIELHGGVSDDGKVLGALLSEYWRGNGQRSVGHDPSVTLRLSGFTAWPQFRAAVNQLREAGFLSGYGRTARPYRLHVPDPSRQRPAQITQRTDVA